MIRINATIVLRCSVSAIDPSAIAIPDVAEDRIVASDVTPSQYREYAIDVWNAIYRRCQWVGGR